MRLPCLPGGRALCAPLSRSVSPSLSSWYPVCVQSRLSRPVCVQSRPSRLGSDLLTSWCGTAPQCPAAAGERIAVSATEAPRSAGPVPDVRREPAGRPSPGGPRRRRVLHRSFLVPFLKLLLDYLWHVDLRAVREWKPKCTEHLRCTWNLMSIRSLGHGGPPGWTLSSPGNPFRVTRI